MITIKYEDFLHEQLKEDAFKREYDELDEEFTTVREVIDLRQRHNSRSRSRLTAWALRNRRSPDQKLALAKRILEQTEGSKKSEVDAMWDQEIRTRVRAFDEARPSTRAASDVFSALDATLSRCRTTILNVVQEEHLVGEVALGR